MSWNSALTAPQLTQLRGAANTTPTYSGAQYCSVCPNTVIFAAQVNQSTFATSFAQVTFDGVTTGAYTDILADMTVILSHTNNIYAGYVVGRARADNTGVVATATVLNINETSVNVADNDYIFVLNDFAIAEKLAREVSATQYKDYALAFRAIPPVVYNLQSAYAGVIASGTSKFRVAFAALALAATSGATISSYSWNIQDGSVISGATNTATVTVDFPVGFRWVHLTVTDSGSRTRVRHIPVWSVPADFSSNVVTGFDGASLTCDATGWNGSIGAFTGIDTVLNHTLVCIWDVENYNGVQGSILSSVKFVGRLRKEEDSGQTDDVYSYIPKTRFDLEGAGAQLGRIAAPLLTLRYKTTPTVWDEIKSLTIWRAIVHLLSEHTTFLTLHDLSFDSTSDSFVAQALNTSGNLLGSVNDLGSAINAVIEFAPAGQAQVIRNGCYLSSSARNALPTVANWTTQDFVDLKLNIEHINLTGRVEGSGGVLNTTSNYVTPLLAIAPGVAQGQGEQRVTLAGQVLAGNVAQASAQSELNTRVGNHLALINLNTHLDITHPDGYNLLIPSVGQWYTWTLSTATNVRGIAFTTAQRWLLTQLSIDHDNSTGRKTVSGTYALETTGDAGDTVTYPAQAQIPIPISSIPAFDPYPNFPDLSVPIGTDVLDAPPFAGNPTAPPQLAVDGNAVVVWTNTQIWRTRRYIPVNSPAWEEITPTLAANEVITDFAFINGTSAAVLTTTMGAQTNTYQTDDSYASPITWVSGSSLPNLYTVIRAASSTDTYALYAPTDGGGSQSTYNDDLTSGLGAQTHIISGSYPFGHWDANTGGFYQASGGRTGGGEIASNSVNGGTVYEASVAIDLGAAYTVVAASFWYINTNFGQSHTDFIAFWDASKVLIGLVNVHSTSDNSWRQNSWTGSVAAVRYVVPYSDGLVSQGNFSAIDDLSVTYQTGGGGGQALVATSTNKGATYGTAQVVGSSPGAFGGFDVIPIGSLTLAGQGTIPAYAIPFGAAFVNYGVGLPGSGVPSVLKIPRFALGSTLTANNGTVPQYLVGSNTLTAGNAALWRSSVGGGSLTNITPSVAGVFGKAVSPNCVDMPFKSGLKAALIYDFGGTRRLMTTTDVSGSPTWTNAGSLTPTADYVQYRRGDPNLAQIYGVGKLDAAKSFYSPNGGGTLIEKASPATGSLIGLRVYG